MRRENRWKRVLHLDVFSPKLRVGRGLPNLAAAGKGRGLVVGGE